MAARAKKPAQSLTEVKRRAEQDALALGLELIDVAIAKESTGSVLRFTIDRDSVEGVSLDDCETFHHRAIKYAQDIDYDYMEVTSPGADRPLKRDRDFERALGQLVEVRFYRQMDGLKQLHGRLAAFDAEALELDVAGDMKRVLRADAALVRLALDDDEFLSPVFEELEQERGDEQGDQDGGESGT